MITKNLKPIFIGVALASLTLIAADGNDLLPSDDTLPQPPRNSPTLSNIDGDFENLIIKLRTLSPVKKRVVSWKNAIADYQASLSADSVFSSLDQIKERILKEGLGEQRNKMVEKAIAGLKCDSQASTSNALLPAAKASPAPTISELPIGFILLSNVPLKQRPYLSSEKRQGSRFAALAEPNTPMSPIGTKVLSPGAIAENLKTHIAAQDQAIDMLSMLAHRFLCNKAAIERGQMVSCSPLHCILTGPTGCGKSETLKKLTELLGVSILYINARSLTDEGFKGQNFSECVSKFCEDNRGKDIRSVIVALEELDKLGGRVQTEEDTKSFGRSIQRILLTPLDGNPISIKDRQLPTPNW